MSTKILRSGGRNLSFEGPKTWASAPERPEKDRFGQAPTSRKLAEVDLDGLFARFVRDENLLWHFASFYFIVYFINSALLLAVWRF